MPLGLPVLLLTFVAVVFVERVGVVAGPIVPDLLDSANTFCTYHCFMQHPTVIWEHKCTVLVSHIGFKNEFGFGFMHVPTTD